MSIGLTPTQAVFTNPSQDGPKLAFGNGQVANNRPAVFPLRANIPGPNSAWTLIEWNKTQYLSPTNLSANDPAADDARYGNPLYRWATPSGESAFSIYRASNGTGYVYNLWEDGGDLSSAGGSNIFLQSDAPGPNESFDRQITYSVQARISQATMSPYPGMTADRLLAQVFTGMLVALNEPGSARFDPSLPTITVFLQIPISDSRGNIARISGPIHNFAQAAGYQSLLVQGLLAGDQSLAFAQDTGPLHTLSYSLNAYVNDIAAGLDFSASGASAAQIAKATAAAHDMSRWTLTGMYIGLETSSDYFATTPSQGTASAGLEVGNIEVTRSAAQTYSFNPNGVSGGPALLPLQPQAGGAAVNPADFSYTDCTTGASGTFAGDHYTGPVAYLQRQYVCTNPDAMSFIANVPNVYLVGGAGNDAITSGPGHNVIDGGAGSNFLTSGTGLDTFFDDARASTPVWDTLVDFHPGDAVTIWGVNQTPDTGSWSAGAGAAGYTGLTLHASASGSGAATLITFAGLSLSDVSSLTVTNGTTGGIAYLYVAHV